LQANNFLTPPSIVVDLQQKATLASVQDVEVSMKHFKALTLLNHSPSQIEGNIETVLYLWRLYKEQTQSKLLLIVADVAFCWKWWKLCFSKTDVGKPCREKIGIVLGWWHPWKQLVKVVWTGWSFVLKPAFLHLFPTATWFDNPKTKNMLQLLGALNEISKPMLRKLQQLQTKQKYKNLASLKLLTEFFSFVLPVIFRTYKLLREHNYYLLLKEQTRIWFLLAAHKSIEYAKAVLMQHFCWFVWEQQNPTIMTFVKQSPTSFNEEIGEVSLSMLARSMQQSPSKVNEKKLKENYAFLNEASNCFKSFENLLNISPEEITHTRFEASAETVTELTTWGYNFIKQLKQHLTLKDIPGEKLSTLLQNLDVDLLVNVYLQALKRNLFDENRSYGHLKQYLTDQFQEF
jgi:hypothetical protein